VTSFKNIVKTTFDKKMDNHTHQSSLHDSMRDQRGEISLRDILSRMIEDNKKEMKKKK